MDDCQKYNRKRDGYTTNEEEFSLYKLWTIVRAVDEFVEVESMEVGT